ncbi:hypothetical protein ACEN88_36075, partial [Massilia sp. CT11-108]|uniref:hypothetical protein n=1 Tax=Massilia sp. CT11-108 TaxID=3393900 RepID=UPI0039A485D3
IVVVAAHARSVKVARLVEVSLPDRIDPVLAALESAGVVVDPSGNVLKASPRALQLGLVSAQQHLVHAEIEDLVALARREGE